MFQSLAMEIVFRSLFISTESTFFFNLCFLTKVLKGYGKKTDGEDLFLFILPFFHFFLIRGGGRDQELLLHKVFNITLFGIFKNVKYVGRTFWRNWQWLFLCLKITVCTSLPCSPLITHPHPLLYSLLGACFLEKHSG